MTPATPSTGNNLTTSLMHGNSYSNVMNTQGTGAGSSSRPSSPPSYSRSITGTGTVTRGDSAGSGGILAAGASESALALEQFNRDAKVVA